MSGIVINKFETLRKFASSGKKNLKEFLREEFPKTPAELQYIKIAIPSFSGEKIEFKKVDFTDVIWDCAIAADKIGFEECNFLESSFTENAKFTGKHNFNNSKFKLFTKRLRLFEADEPNKPEKIIFSAEAEFEVKQISKDDIKNYLTALKKGEQQSFKEFLSKEAGGKTLIPKFPAEVKLDELIREVGGLKYDKTIDFSGSDLSKSTITGINFRINLRDTFCKDTEFCDPKFHGGSDLRGMDLGSCIFTGAKTEFYECKFSLPIRSQEEINPSGWFTWVKSLVSKTISNLLIENLYLPRNFNPKWIKGKDSVFDATYTKGKTDDTIKQYFKPKGDPIELLAKFCKHCKSLEGTAEQKPTLAKFLELEDPEKVIIDLRDLKFGSFDQVDFQGYELSEPFNVIDFSGLNLSGCDFSRTEFRSVNFSGTYARNSIFNNAIFTIDSRLTSPIDPIDSSLTSPIDPIDAKKADFSGCSFRGINAADGVFTHAKLELADFTKATLSGADLSEITASGARFVKCRADLADFSKARLDRADFSKAIARAADFSGVTADHIKFESAILSDARFTGATLDYANFIGAALYGASFDEAKLYRAKLSSKLAGATFVGVEIDELSQGADEARQEQNSSNAKKAWSKICKAFRQIDLKYSATTVRTSDIHLYEEFRNIASGAGSFVVEGTKQGAKMAAKALTNLGKTSAEYFLGKFWKFKLATIIVSASLAGQFAPAIVMKFIPVLLLPAAAASILPIITLGAIAIGGYAGFKLAEKIANSYEAAGSFLNSFKGKRATRSDHAAEQRQTTPPPAKVPIASPATEEAWADKVGRSEERKIPKGSESFEQRVKEEAGAAQLPKVKGK